ncbi:MAG: ChaN family lipoprotein [Betaproteobacteria bacterium]
MNAACPAPKPAPRAAAPRRLAIGLALLSLLWGPAQAQPRAELSARLAALPQAQVLLLGEQHDAAEHQQIAKALVQTLAAQGQLGALVLEMLPAGRSSKGLDPDSTQEAVRQALGWDERAWPWPPYGPVVMAAVAAGVPVLGGNLPNEALRASMARSELDQRLPTPALEQQKQLMREGHCGLLPESQIGPMARMQIARDLSLAAAVQSAAEAARPGQQVLLLAGSVHADKQLGVPWHLPASLRSVSVRLLSQGSDPAGASFDALWPTAPAPATDHCAALREQFKGRGAQAPARP